MSSRGFVVSGAGAQAEGRTGSCSCSQLAENTPVGVMDRIGYRFPALHLRLGMDARRPRGSLPHRGHLRCFRHDECAGSTLPIVRGVELPGDVALPGTISGQRCHCHTVAQLEGAELDRRKKGVFHEAGRALLERRGRASYLVLYRSFQKRRQSHTFFSRCYDRFPEPDRCNGAYAPFPVMGTD